MNPRVLFAVFKRNFVSYFSSPTGYVFICVFVLLSSIAAFLPDDFFNANLANLNQLNYWFPFIMLVFVPAIAMSIWAEERHEGTDELLLTIPAADIDVVLGKYAAAVAIFTCSLLFSLVCNFWVLRSLGQPDVGLFLGTYFGYWLIGLLMLAVGMVASFLTSDLTVAYILGALLNAPLVILGYAGSTALPTSTVRVLKDFSISGQFETFGRGVVALSHITFFIALAVVMLYLSTILIARRHWTATRRVEGSLHYGTRVTALVIAVLSFVVVAQRFDPLEADVTSERINSLSPATLAILDRIEETYDAEYPVQITAFISPEVPEPYVKTKIDVENVLHEIASRGGDKIRLEIIPTEAFSDNAELAENRYGITPHPVRFDRGGVTSMDRIFLGVAFQSGLEKPVIIEFIERAVPVEYELVRSLCTVTKQSRKKIGVVRTGVDLFQAGGPPSPDGNQPYRIVQELRKAYDVVPVDPSSEIKDEYDALLVVQPSSLRPEQMENFIDAVERGIPTAVFEDPCPMWMPVMASSEEPQFNPMMGSPPEPKGNIRPLWERLGVDYDPTSIVWQDYNPYPKLADLDEEFVFVDTTASQVPDLAQIRDDLLAGIEKDAPVTITAFLSPAPPDVYRPTKAEIEGVLRRLSAQAGDKIRLEIRPTTTASDHAKTAASRYGILPRQENVIEAGLSVTKDVFLGVAVEQSEQKPVVVEFFDRPETGIEYAVLRCVCNATGQNPEILKAVIKPFNEANPISSGTQHVTLPFPGHFAPVVKEGVTFSPLVRTIKHGGLTRYDDLWIWAQTPFGRRNIGLDDRRLHQLSAEPTSYIVAAEIKAPLAVRSEEAEQPSEEAAEDSPEEASDAQRPERSEIHVVVVSDVDMIADGIFRLRDIGQIIEEGLVFDFDNVTLVLNVLDGLAGDTELLELRKWRPQHRTLETIDALTADARRETRQRLMQAEKDHDELIQRANEELQARLEEHEESLKRISNITERENLMSVFEETARKQLAAETEELERELDAKLDKIKRSLEMEIRRRQDWYKFWAVVLPPVPPLLVAIGVFFVRRRRETEGVSRSRMK